MWAYARAATVPLAPLLDTILPVWALSAAIQRWGCWLNGCCYGRETATFLATYAPDEAGRWAFRYPTQIMQSALNLLLYVFLVAHRRRQPYDGRVSALFLFLYFSGRFFMATLRGDGTWLDLPVRGRVLVVAEIQVWSLAFVVGAVLWLWRRERRRAPSTRMIDPRRGTHESLVP